MSSYDQSRRDIVEHERKQKEKQDRENVEQRVKRLISECSRYLEAGGAVEDPLDIDYYYLLYDDLHRLANEVEQYGYGDLLTLADGVVSTAAYDALVEFETGLRMARPVGRRRAVSAFEGLVAIAESLDIVTDELRNRAIATGVALKTGEQLQDWDMNLGDVVQTVTFQAGSLKTLYCGNTGLGKSCGVETETEDFYQRTHREGQDYKVIDLVDLGKGESWIYDIPQQKADLRSIREEMGLQADFTEPFADVVDREFDDKQPPYTCPQCDADFDDLERLTEHGEDKHPYASPDVEVFVPLTPGLAAEDLPYDTEAERFTVTPFVVPAADIDKSVLIACILSRVSDQEENTIRQAYDDINEANDDWSLADLAAEIRSRDELSAKHKADAIGVLRSLQSEGFIRTREHPRTINWRELFFDTETISVFSQAFIPDRRDIAQMICLAYLADTILNKRETMYEVPEAALIMREFWEVAPHSKRQSSDARAAAIQEAIGERMTRAFRKARDYKLHLLCDTQEPGDLLKSVREVFNRYVVYSANKDTVKDIFEWTQNDRWQSFLRTVTVKKGQAGIVGQVKPAVDRRRIEYLSPVEFAPPSHHHFDKFTDSTGWHARAKYLEHEELRAPLDIDGVEWDDQVPEHLRITEGEETDTGPGVDMRPVVAFADRCLQKAQDKHDFIRLEDVRAAFNAFLADHEKERWDFDNRGVKTKFGKRLRKGFDDGTFEKKRRNGEHSLVGLVFSREGLDYLERAGHVDDSDQFDSAAEPIHGGD